MPRWWKALGSLLLLPVLLAAAVASAPNEGKHWQWPLSPTPDVVAPFVPPAQPYGAGHRGVDLAGSLGQPVLAVAAGTVSFAGVIAGLGVVVVDHGDLRSTYQPVLAGVRRGDTVQAGQVIGTLETLGSHCLPEVCLHLGVRRGDEYLDPLSLLGSVEIRLKSPLATATSGPSIAGSSSALEQSSVPQPVDRSRASPDGNATAGPARPSSAVPGGWVGLAATAGGAAAGAAAPLALRRRVPRRP